MTTPTAADKERAFEILHRRSILNAESPGWWEESGDLIAQALADERERAAVIAEEAHRTGRVSRCDQIADAIRSQA